MASNKPVIHGRDHLPGGADPIPGLREPTRAAPVHSAYALKPLTDAGLPNDTDISVAWNAGDETFTYTNGAAPVTADPNFAPYSDDFFAVDWQTEPTTALTLNVAGIYLVGASFFIATTSLGTPPADMWEMFFNLAGSYSGGIMSAAELSDHRSFINPGGAFLPGSIDATYMAHNSVVATVTAPPKTITMSLHHTAGALSTLAGAAGDCAVFAIYLGPFA